MNAMLEVNIQLLFCLLSAVVTGRVGTRAASSSDLQPRLLTQVQAPMSVVGTGARRPTVAVVLGGGGLRENHLCAFQVRREPLPTGFGIQAELEISVPGLPKAQVHDLVEQAHIVCPYSNATRGNIDVSLVIA